MDGMWAGQSRRPQAGHRQNIRPQVDGLEAQEDDQEAVQTGRSVLEDDLELTGAIPPKGGRRLTT